jgi:hypothetical protein
VRSMAPERVTVTITSSAGEDTPLTVQDAMQQILDFFDLLSAAGGEDRSTISWRLVSISMSSPIRATAEAFSEVPGVPAEATARREKEALLHAFGEFEQQRVPDWMGKVTLTRAKALLTRNMDAIARTDVDFEIGDNVVSIVPRLARVAVATIEDAERKEIEAQDDFSRTEIGSFEAYVIGLTTHYNRPAVEVRERQGDSSIKCPLTSSLAEKVGNEHRWAEVWTNQRVLVSGRVTYRKDGRVAGCDVFEIYTLNPPPIALADIVDPNFTGGRDATTYLRSLWSADVG